MRLIKNCRRIIVSFNNNDSNENTAQKLAQKFQEEVLKYGIKTVDILPIALLDNYRSYELKASYTDLREPGGAGIHHLIIYK
ncbi:hypothetical protein [Fluviispira multicolorata]|uniref:Uncharacterized protein n=1 Tax=Fluviispira multicolorata TaxID=2654512 RepID=A0A833N140_9BACT|nr:hypothetical protein [Fluviispira multicolorata]KAB8029880.1 hypothetical protein GCL57_10100 [Fluviispira multicolorata]